MKHIGGDQHCLTRQHPVGLGIKGQITGAIKNDMQFVAGVTVPGSVPAAPAVRRKSAPGKIGNQAADGALPGFGNFTHV